MGDLFYSRNCNMAIKLLLLCSLLIVSSYATQNQIFAWSNSHLSDNVQKLDTIYSSDVSSLLHAAVGSEQNEFSQYFSAETPKVSLLFLADSKLTQFPSLQNLLNSFSGNLAMPYGYFTDSVTSSISAVAEQTKNIFTVGDFSVEGATVLSFTEALELVKDSKESSFVIVDIRGDKSEAEKTVVAFSDLIREQSGVAIMMDISTDNTQTIEFTSSQKGYRSMKQVLEYGETALYDTRFPAYIIEGLIVAFMLVFIAVVGIVCTCQLQSPEGFETPHKHRD